MHYAFPFLPLEVQTSIKELIALGNLPEGAIDLLIERTAKAIEDKTNSAQRQVTDIEQSMERRVDRIGARLADELRTTLGETNGMLVDIRTAVQQQEAAVTGLRAEFHDGMQAIGERVTDNEGRIGSVEQRMTASESDRAELHTQMDRVEKSIEDNHQESQIDRKALHEQIDRLEKMVTIALTGVVTPERRDQLIAMIEAHDKHIKQIEAGG